MADERVDLLPNERKRIRGRISEIHFVQNRLAALLEVSQPTFSDKLNGASSFTAEEIAKVAWYLQLDALMARFPLQMTRAEKYRLEREFILGLLAEQLDSLATEDERHVWYYAISRYCTPPIADILEAFSRMEIRPMQDSLSY